MSFPWLEHPPLPPAILGWEQLFLHVRLSSPSSHPTSFGLLHRSGGSDTCDTAAGTGQGSAYMVETGPHHLELINQLLMQRAHFWVHELLMNCQPDSKNMNLVG